MTELGLEWTQKDEPFIDQRNPGRLADADAGAGVPA